MRHGNPENADLRSLISVETAETKTEIKQCRRSFRQRRMCFVLRCAPQFHILKAANCALTHNLVGAAKATTNEATAMVTIAISENMLFTVFTCHCLYLIGIDVFPIHPQGCPTSVDVCHTSRRLFSTLLWNVVEVFCLPKQSDRSKQVQRSHAEDQRHRTL